MKCGRPAASGRPCRSNRAQPAFSDPERWTPPACVHHLTLEEKDLYAASQARSAEAQRTFPQRYHEMLLQIERDRRAAEDDGLPEWACRRGPCTNRRMVRWNYATAVPNPKVCEEHLTDAERVALEHADAELRRRLERLAHEPDCWSWPTPDPCDYATEEEASDALFAWQHGRGCAICGDTSRLVQDHDHKTGLVRGNLCHTCNVKEGQGSTRAPFVKYRERNPASILGVKVRYWSSWTGYAEPEPELTPQEQSAEEIRLRAAVDRLSFPLPHDDRTET